MISCRLRRMILATGLLYLGWASFLPAIEPIELSGYIAPAFEKGSRITRSLGRSVEQTTLSVADQFYQYRFHDMFSYRERWSHYGFMLLSQYTGDKKYLEHFKRTVDYWLANRDKFEEFSDWVAPTDEEMITFGICPWCGTGDPDDWREPPIRRRFDWVRHRDSETMVRNWMGDRGGFYGPAIGRLYLETKDPRYLEVAKEHSGDPRESLTPDGKLIRGIIIDGAQGACNKALLGKITGDKAYFDLALAYLYYCVENMRNEQGLYYQGFGYMANPSTHTPVVWGRGTGWWMLGASETLTYMPRSDPRWKQLQRDFQTHCEAVLPWQDSAGLWHQIIDRWDSYPGSSATGLIAFGMARGINEGFLPEKPYRLAVLKAFQGLKGLVDTNGIVRNCCIGCGPQDDAYDYYARPLQVNDPHGPGPVMMAGAEIMRMQKEKGGSR